MKFKRICFLGAAFGLVSIWGASAELRSYTSSDGSKTMEGELLSYDSSKGLVTMKSEKGRTKTFKAALLSKKDQTFIAEWAKTQVNGRKIWFDIQKTEGKGKERESQTHRLISKDAGYKIKLRNTGGNEMQDLEVEYQIVYTKEAWAKPGARKTVDAEVVASGALKLDSLASNAERALSTKRVDLESAKKLPVSKLIKNGCAT